MLTNQVVGISGNPKAGFIWDATNGLRNLMIPASNTDGGVGGMKINNKGVVVGSTWNYSSVAFQWDSVNGIQWLNFPAIADYPYYGADAINDGGAIAYENWSYSGAPGKSYFISQGTATWIGELYPGAYTGNLVLNNRNEMAGACSPPSGRTNQAFFWKSGQGMAGLGFLPGYSNSFAYAINDASQVVGYCNNSGNYAAFIWTSDAGMSQLGSIGTGWSNSLAQGISAGGIVVGVSKTAGTNYAVAWVAGQNGVSLSTLVTNLSGWANITEAIAINESGVIVGDGLRTNGVRHAFVLYPVIPPAITNDLKMYAGVKVYGAPGNSVRVDYTTNLNATPVPWNVLTNITLQRVPEVIIDYGSENQPKRFYRTVPQ